MSREKLLNWYKKAALNKQQGKHELARDLFRKILKKDPSILDVWFELGDLELQHGKYESAEKCFLKVVAGNPEFVMGHAYLGLCYYNMNFLQKAVNSYKNVLKHQPENLSAICNIGLSLLNMGLRDEAVEYCRKAISINPRFSGAYVLLGNALSALGRYEESCDSYGKALDIQPDDIRTVGGMADSLIKLGDCQQAYSIVSPYIEAGSDDVDINVAYATASKEVGEQEPALKCLETLIRKKDLTNDQYIQLYFAAGSLCDSLGQYDTAFDYYKAGNKRVNRIYSEEEDRNEVDRIIATFSENRKQDARAEGLSRRHVFIIGMPRSGTSLVEQIFSRHSKVFVAGELNMIPELSVKSSKLTGSKKDYPECMDALSDDAINVLAEEYEHCFSEANDNVTILTDKLPHNFRYLGFIEKLFPNAIVIHCKRNPLDTCLSNYFQYFSGAIAYPYTLENIGAHFLQYQRLMLHWNSVLNLPILDINYEELVSDQESVSRKMIELCGLEWEPACLNFHNSNRVTRTASHAQVRKKIYSSSVEKWRNYEAALEPLIRILNK